MAARSLCAAVLASGLLPGAAIGAAGIEQAPASGTGWVLPLAATVSVKMAWIPPGTFLMGSAASEPLHRRDEARVTRVRLSRGYWLATTMVTIGEWKALMGRGVRAQLERALRDDRRYDFGGKKQAPRTYMHFAADADAGENLTGEAHGVPMY